MRRATVSTVTALALSALLAAGCSVNPATGKSQLSLVSEGQEIQMGRQAHQDVVRQMGVYQDENLQAYVQSLGKRLAAESERPDLPWSFVVVDDPVVNAFALPGGYIYVTRGMLAHAGSEAELVGVLGHEIGHVTGRHSVEQMSRAQLANIGLAAAMVVSSEVAQYGQLASTGLGLMFLKFGRDDERESDELGLRYLVAAGYDPDEMSKVFTTLDRSSRLEGGGRIPAWMSTHPDPGDRAARIDSMAASLTPEQRDGRINRESYLHRLDDLAYGENPREGYTIENVFYHPDLRFQLKFPRGWQISNQTASVAAQPSSQDAIIVLTLAEEGAARSRAKFFAEPAVERGPRWQGFDNFRTTPSPGQSGYRGLIGFIEHRGMTYQLVGYTATGDWARHERAIQSSVTTFETLSDPRRLDVVGQRIEIVEIDRAMTVAEFHRAYPSDVSVERVAVLNGVDEHDRLPAGSFVKRVVGGR